MYANKISCLKNHTSEETGVNTMLVVTFAVSLAYIRYSTNALPTGLSNPQARADADGSSASRLHQMLLYFN